MKHSGLARIVVPAVVVALDLLARLALPAALLSLTRGMADLALTAALVSTIAGGARSLVLGVWTERLLARTWREVTVAACRGPITSTRVREPGESTELLAAVREVAVHRAQSLPRLVSLGLVLAVTGAATGVLLGTTWLLFGAACAALLGGFVAVGHVRLRRAYDALWSAFHDTARDAAVLLDALVELRAHGRDTSFAEGLLAHAHRMARQERVVTVSQVLVSLVPASLAVVSVAGPLRAGAAWAVAALGSTRELASAGILGAVALSTGVSLAQSLDQALRSAPLCKTLDAFLAPVRAGEAPAPREGGTAVLHGSLSAATLAFEDLSYTYPGSPVATPSRASHRWSEVNGLAVLGANGAGKSTIALALLGLLEPTVGRVVIDGTPLQDLDLLAYRRRISYLPQGAFFAPGESVAWHVRLFAEREVSDQRVDAALAEVGLLPVLGEHVKRGSKPPREVLAGELSGGERQRMHLCRALVEAPELVILDEPEVGLDSDGRLKLRVLLEKLARDRRVLVIAHDEAIVPPSFDRMVCARG